MGNSMDNSMGNSMGKRVRELTPLEASFALPWHRPAEENPLPMNAVLGVQCILSEALVARFDSVASMVQQRHPLLRCSIGRGEAPDGEELGPLAIFETDTPLKVEVRGAETLKTEALEGIQAECLNWKDTSPGALLAKIVAIQDASKPGAWVIYFALCHAMLDGRSKQIVATEFFALLGDPEGTLPEMDAATERMTFAEMLADADVKPADGMGAYFGAYFKARAGLKDAKLTGPSAAIAAQTATMSLLHGLDATATTAVVKKAKSLGVTVNTLLAYEWTTTVAAHGRFNVPAGVDLTVGGPMDARSSLGLKYSHTLSNLFGPAGAVLASGASAEEHMNEISSKYKEIRAKNWHVAPFSRPKDRDKDKPDRWASAPLEEVCSSFPNSCCGFSNLGRVEFARAEGLTIERSWSAGGAYPDVNLICMCVTTAGVCTFSFQFVTPAHSRADAERLVAAFRVRLEALCA